MEQPSAHPGGQHCGQQPRSPIGTEGSRGEKFSNDRAALQSVGLSLLREFSGPGVEPSLWADRDLGVHCFTGVFRTLQATLSMCGLTTVLLNGEQADSFNHRSTRLGEGASLG